MGWRRQARLRRPERRVVHPGVHWAPAVAPAQSGVPVPAVDPRFTAVRDHALEPRIGVVADLAPLGGLVAKAHWGRYHQPMFAALFDRVEGAGTYGDDEIWSYLGTAPGTPTQTFTLAERCQ